MKNPVDSKVLGAGTTISKSKTLQMGLVGPNKIIDKWNGWRDRQIDKLADNWTDMNIQTDH